MKYKLILFMSFFMITACSYGQQLKDTVVDIDGNVYHTIKIGTQVWMAENLKVTHYLNGEAIPNVTDAIQWSKLTTGSYCNYNNNTNIGSTYGKLYNYYAVNDSRNIAPKGWHIPSDGEWNIMEIYLDNTIDTTEVSMLGTGTDISKKLKESGTSHWESGNNGTNSSNFTALPGGYRNYDGSFSGISQHGGWWTATVYRADAWYRQVRFGGDIFKYSIYKVAGFSVRCIKDN